MKKKLLIYIPIGPFILILLGEFTLRNLNGEKTTVETRTVFLIPTVIENVKLNEVLFQVSALEGPYRIFVHINDQFGNFATTNTPFYVLNSK